MQRLVLVLLCWPLIAQTGGSLLSRADFIENWETSKEFTLAVAGVMPEKFYAFKPNPAEMDFAPAPKDLDKAAIIYRLRESFDYCIAKLGTITDDQLKKQYPVGWNQRPAASGSQILLGMYVHNAHHRAQAEVYMRANDVKPPAYRP